MTVAPTFLSASEGDGKNTVRANLTGDRKPKPAKAVVENKEYAAFFGRIVRAYVKRIASGDVEALTDLLNADREIRSLMNEALAKTVTGLRHDHGYTWTDIARVAGITKQTAQERWGGTSK